MVAVLIEINVDGIQRDAVLTQIREESVPALKSQPGFVSGTWLAGGGYPRTVSLTLWETERHVQSMIHQFGLSSGRLMSPRAVRVEIRQIAATA